MIKRLLVGLLALIFSMSIWAGGDVYQGSGFFINQRGYIVTAAHMVKGKNPRIVVKYRGKYYLAQIVVISKTDDIAIIRTSIRNSYSFALTASLNPKGILYVIGFPYTHRDSLIVTRGYFRDEGKEIGIVGGEYTACAGNSGGVVISQEGNAAGVLVSGYDSNGTECSYDSQAVGSDRVIDLALINNIIMVPSIKTQFTNISKVLTEIIRQQGVVEIFEFE